METEIDERELMEKIGRANRLLNKGGEEAVAEAVDLVAEVDEALFFGDEIKPCYSTRVFAAYNKLSERIYSLAEGHPG